MPDVEALVYAALADLGGIRVFAYDSGSAAPFVVEATSLQVDVRASSKQKARDRAYVARDRVCNLPASQSPGHILRHVNLVAGPLWQPDEDGAPRYVLRVTVTYRRPRVGSTTSTH